MTAILDWLKQPIALYDLLIWQFAWLCMCAAWLMTRHLWKQAVQQTEGQRVQIRYYRSLLPVSLWDGWKREERSA